MKIPNYVDLSNQCLEILEQPTICGDMRILMRVKLYVHFGFQMKTVTTFFQFPIFPWKLMLFFFLADAKLDGVTGLEVKGLQPLKISPMK